MKYVHWVQFTTSSVTTSRFFCIQIIDSNVKKFSYKGQTSNQQSLLYLFISSKLDPVQLLFFSFFFLVEWKADCFNCDIFLSRYAYLRERHSWVYRRRSWRAADPRPWRTVAGCVWDMTAAATPAPARVSRSTRSPWKHTGNLSWAGMAEWLRALSCGTLGRVSTPHQCLQTHDLQVHGSKRLDCRAGYQEVSRCYTSGGESEESIAHRQEKVQGIRSGIETQDRHYHKTGIQWPHKKDFCPPK